jgi:hypothetical protein
LPLRAGAQEFASAKPVMAPFLAGARQRAQS